MRPTKARNRERGASTIEMTLVGIPLMFVLISIFEISRGMWTYHTMATAVREATRYAMVHGQNCVYTPPTITNNCSITVGNLATRLRDYGAGIICPDGTYSCVQMEIFPPPSAGCSNMADCLTNTSTWPTPGSNGVGSEIRVGIRMPFTTALAVLWPGAGSVQFGRIYFTAEASERIQF